MADLYGENTAPDRRPADSVVPGRKVTNVRVGTHPEQRFDRVVFDLSAAGEPAWNVFYTDDPRREGSGDPVDVPGSAALVVVIEGVDWTDQKVPEYGGAPIDKDWPALAGVRWDGSFEGQTQAFVGTTSRLPFRVGTATDPTRIYVDIAHVRT